MWRLSDAVAKTARGLPKQVRHWQAQPEVGLQPGVGADNMLDTAGLLGGVHSKSSGGEAGSTQEEQVHDGLHPSSQSVVHDSRHRELCCRLQQGCVEVTAGQRGLTEPTLGRIQG